MESSLNFYQSDHQQPQQQQRRQESIDKNSTTNRNHNNNQLKNLSKFNYDVGSNNNKQFRINKLSKITSIDSKGGNSNNNGSNSDRISRNDYYNNLTTSLPFKHHHHHHQRKSFSTSPSSSIFSKKTNTAAAAAKFPFQSKKSTTFHYQNVKDSIKNFNQSPSSSPSHYHHYSRQNPNSRFSSPTATTTTTNSLSSSSSSSTQNLLQISSTLKNINNSSSNNKRQQQQDQKYNDNDDDDENLLDWLEAELDQRGIDSFIYSRYLLSLLQQYPPQQQQSTNDDDNLEDNLNEPDSGYEGSITTNNNFRFKQFLSAASTTTTTTGRPEKLRYCESHQRLYRGSPSLSSTTTTSSTSSSSSSSSSSSTQLNPFSLFNNRSSLKIQRPKNNQQKAPTTTKWMHKRYRQLTTDNKSQYNSGRGRSMSNDRFNEQNDYNDDNNNNNDDDDFDDDLMLIDCPDCYRKYSRKKDYRKFMLSKCLKSAIDKDMMIKPTDFDEFIDEICQKFDQQQQNQTNDDDDDDRHRKLLQFSSTNRNRQSNDNNNNGGKQQQEEKVKTTTELILDQAKRYYDAFPALGNESMIMTKSSSSSSSTTSTLKSSSGSRSNSHSGSSSRNKISISENFRSSQQSSFDDSVFIDNNNGQTLVDNNDNDDTWNGKKIIRNIVEKYQPKLNVISTNVEDFHHQQQQELQNQSTTTASSSNSIQQQPQNLGKPLVVKLKSKLLGNNNKSRTGLIVTTSSTSNIDNIDNDNINNNNNANINNNNNNGDRMTTLKKLSTTINNNNNNNSIIVMNNNYNNNNNNDETINGKRMEMVKNSEHYDQQQQQQNQSILAENQILSATIKSITNHNNNNNTHSNHNSSSSSTGLSAKEIEKINQLMPSYLMNQHSKTNLTQTTISTMTTTTTTLPSTSTISVIKLKNDKNNKHYSSNQTMNRSINVQNVVIGEQQRKLSTLSSINHRSYSNTKRDFQSSSSSNNGRKFQPYQKLSIISSTDKYQDKIADNQIVDDQHDDEEKNGQSLTKNDGKSVDSLLPDFLKSTSVQQQQQQSPIKQKLSMAINDEKILENSILAKDDIENDNEKNVNENININSDDDDDGHTKMTVKCSSLKQLSPLFLLMDCQNVIDNDNQNDLLFNNVDDNNGQQNQQQQQQTLLINDCNIDNDSMKPLLSSFMMNDNNHMVNENDGNSLDDNIATTTTTSKTTLWKSELMIYDDDDHIDKKHRNKDDDSDCHMEIITKKSSQSSIFANEDEELEEYIMSTTTTISPSSSSTTTKTTSSSLLYETIDEWLDYHEKEFWPKSMTKIFQQFSNDNSGGDDNDETNWWQPIKSMFNDNIDCDDNKNHKEEESPTTTTTMMPEFWDHKRRMEWLTNLWNQNSTLGYMNDMFMMNSTDNNRQKNLNEELSLIIDLVQQQRQCQNQMTDNEKTTNSNEFNLTTIDSDGDVGGATIDSKLLNFYSFDDEMMQHFRKNFAEKMNNYHLNVNNNDNNSKCPNQIDKLDSKSEQNLLIDDNLQLPTTLSSSSLSSSPSNDVINLTEMINNVLDSINRERQNEIEVDSNECFLTSLSIPIQSTGSSTSSLSSSFSNSDDLPSDFDVEKIPTSFLHKDQNNTTIESANVVETIAPKPSGPFSKRYKLKSNANSADDNSKNDDNNYINGHVVTSNTNVDHSTFYSLRTSSYRHQQQNWYPTGSELQNDCSDYQGPHDDNIYYYGDDMDGGIMIDQNEATHFVESYGNDLYNYDGYLINMPKDDNNDLSMMNTNQLMSNNSFGKQNSFLTSSNDIDNLQPVDIKFKLENRYLVPDSDSKPVLKPCAFYLENACARLDCKFSHDLSSIPCKYYLEGACYKEEFCPFLHEKPKSDFDQIDSETLNSSTTSYMNFKSSQFKIESDSDFPSLFDEPKNTSSETNDNLFENQRVNFLYKTTTNLMKPAVVDARKSPLQSNDMKSNYEDSIPSSSSSSYIPNSSYSSQNFAKCFNATKTAKTSSSSLVLPSPQQQLKIKVVEQPKQEEEEWPSLSGSLEKSSSIDKNNSSNQTKKILNNNNSSLSTTKSSLSLTSSSTTTTTTSLTTTNKVISLKNTNNRNNGSNFRDKVLMKSMSKKNKKNQLINNNNNNNDHQSLTATTKNTSSLKSIMKSF